MAEALYRKYRPQTFEDVVGQTHIERTLKNAIESDKVSHAYLFCGPRGTGKTTTARLLAKALLCEGGPTPSPDGTCEQCHAIAEGTHPDVSELDAASRTGVENVREEIIGRVQYAPTRGRYKIYIIDEVHMLSTAAFNALLKTLEEPPDHVVFVLCTTDPQRVPETIHSRCQRFDFHRLSSEEIVSRLGAVCVAEGVEFEGDALDLVAHRAQGGMRDALTALEQLIAFGGGNVTVEVAQSVLGSIDTDDMSTVATAIASRDAAACFTWLSDYVETGADLARFARDLAGYVRDLYVLALTDGALAVDAPQAARPAMAKEAALFGVDRLAYILGVLGDLSTELRTSVNPRLSFEIALTRMVRPESDVTLESLAARVASLEAALASGAGVPAVAAGAAMPSSPAAVVAEGGAKSHAAAAPAAQGGSSTARAESATVRNAPSAAGPAASVPPVSSGYRQAPPQSAAPDAPAPAAATAAMDKTAAFRAELERRRAAQAQANKAPEPAPAPAQPQAAAAHSADSAAAAGVSDEIRAKLSDPSALQRGWQAALADLKRQRAAYGALLLSARAVAQEGGNGLFIEFSRENGFAFSAAQKPDIAAAIAAALQHAFGAPVPFSVTQGEGSVSPAKAAMARVAAMRAAAPVSAPAAPEPTQAAAYDSAPAVDEPVPYSDADAVPYDDADAVPYSDEDARSFAPWDDAEPAAYDSSARSATAAASPAPAGGVGAPPSHAVSPSDQNAKPASAAPAELAQTKAGATRPVSTSSAMGAAAEAPSASESADDAAEPAPVLSVEGPEPVDPYAVGKKLGFDSMPAPKKRPKGTIVPSGWPGIEESKKTVRANSHNPASTSASDAKETRAEGAVPSDAAAPVPHAADRPGVGASDQPPARSDESASSAQAASPADEGVFAADAASVPAEGAPGPSSEPPQSSNSDTAAVPARPHPFASRPMPAGIGGKAAAPAPRAAARVSEERPSESMDVADIFGAFGVSFDKVQEEQ